MKGPLEKMGFKVELVPSRRPGQAGRRRRQRRHIIADKDILLVVGASELGRRHPVLGEIQGVAAGDDSARNYQLPPSPTATIWNVESCVRGRDDVQGVVGAEFAKSKG